MFAYNLKGKYIILVLAEEFLKIMKTVGLPGSPVYAKVHSLEERGFWLENTSFPLCPPAATKLFDAKGEEFCRAHIFIPAEAVVSVVAFPQKIGGLENTPDLYAIGFRPKKKQPSES